jgi:uncharacterized membrane protein YvlD (DUF360 family)
MCIAIVPRIYLKARWFALFILGLIFGLLNAVVRPVLKLLHVP